MGVGSGARSAGFLGLCAVVACLLAGLLGASVAQAANSFVPAGEISAGELTGPARIAVEESTGNVLVVDSAKNRVDVFDSSGPGASLLTTFGEGDLSGSYGIAIDQSNGDVYVTDPGNEQILRYETDGNPNPTYTLDAGYAGPAAGAGGEEVGSFASAIAVDPTNGDLLVADRGNNRVSRFDSTGAFVSSFDGADSPDGAFTHLEDVTLSPAGKIFVADGEVGAAPSRVLRFSIAGAYEATLREPSGSGDAYLAYDAKHTELIVGDGRECFFCTVSFHVLDPASGNVFFDVSVPAEQITGLASDPESGRLYTAISRGEFFGSPKVEVYAPQTHPELVLNAPGSITDTSVHLSGTVNPDGVATEYHFEVSKDGGTTWQESAAGSAGEGTSPVAVEADLTVEPNTEYIARLVASNTDGAQDATSTQSFTTEVSAPMVEVLPASDLGEHSVVINGRINPFGLQTTFYFEYGPTTAYGTKVPADIESVAGNGHVTKSVSRTVSGLTPGASYHFRLVATNSAGTTQSADATFTTLPPGDAPVRAYEQVTPPDKHGAAIADHFGLQASADGNAISYLTKAGPNSSAIFTRAVAIRGSDDWSGRIDTDPPVNTISGGFLVHPTLAISADFTHALVTSNRALLPGAFEDGGNLYLKDLRTGSYQFIGGSNAVYAFSSYMSALTNNVFQAGAPDFSWIVFYSRNPLLPGAPNHALYRWSESGGLEVISILPDGDMTGIMHGSAMARYDSVSADGSRVYFGSYQGSEDGVFLREGNGPTKAVSVSHVPGDPATPQYAVLMGVSKSGRYAFFVSNAKLTSDAPDAGGNPEHPGYLYRYDASDEGLEYLGAKPYTYPLDGPDGRIVNEASYGVGDDGETVYFDAQDEFGGIGPFSVWHKGEVHTILPEKLEQTEERRSPDGRYYVFSKTVDGVSSVIERYDADTNEISCVSCLPDGTPVSAEMPAAAGFDTVISNQHSRSVLDNGTVYFDTTASLVAADVNGTRDVYAWRDGSPTLISPGNEPINAYYADSSANGSDVFFTTGQKLVGRDNDRSTDIYDARVNGGLPAQSPPPSQECGSKDCRSTESGPPEASFGSEGINGARNVHSRVKKTCGKGKHKVKVKGKVRCVKRHKANKNKKGGNR